MPRDWEIRVRKGAYDGWMAETDIDPAEVLILWRCATLCDGHGTFSPENPEIVMKTAEPYRRVALDAEQRVAVYEPADSPTGPSVQEDERELIGVGRDFSGIVGTPMVALGGAGPTYGEGLWP